jgi:hypothetical protein
VRIRGKQDIDPRRKQLILSRFPKGGSASRPAESSAA